MDVKRVAILGAGNGGITAALDLKSRGFEVALYELPKFGNVIETLRETEPLSLKEEGGTQRVGLDLLTTDIVEAVTGAQVVMLTIPSTWVESFAEVVAPVVGEDQIILLHTAACLGAVRFVRAAQKAGVKTRFKIGELNTLAYGTRAFPEKGEVELSLRVKHLLFAAYPAGNTAQLLGPCRQLYPCIEPAADIWHTALTNGNPEAHCTSILNAGRIDYSKGEFWLYVEGITPHTVKIIEQVCKERLELGKALGLELDDARVARIKRGYLLDEPKPLDELFNTSPVFSKIKGPTSLESRYLVEDISNGIAFYSSLGRALGVPTPASDAIVTLGGFLLDRDFMAEGITLEKFGFGGMDAGGLKEAVA